MTLLNSNYEDWRRANPTAKPEDFPFSCKKLNPAGALFDYAKLCDVSKNVISTMTAQEIYGLTLEYAREFDPEFGEALASDPAYATAIFAIGRGGKKPRKDLATWKEAKPYMGFFYDRYFDWNAPFPENFPADAVRTALMGFLASYDPQDDAIAWFDKVKALAESMGFTANMKLYKQDPTAWPGSVADVSTFLRIALTGKTNSPDLYTVMQLLGPDRSKARLQAAINRL